MAGGSCAQPDHGTLSPDPGAALGTPTHGGTPRFFTLDPAERFLYIANQDGHTIVAYKVGRDGRLSPTRLRVRVGSPACLVLR